MSLKNCLFAILFIGCNAGSHLNAGMSLGQMVQQVVPLTSHNQAQFNSHTRAHKLTPVQYKSDDTSNKVTANKKQIFAHSGDAVLGNLKGSQQFAVFVDPYCSHCRDFQKIMNQAVIDMPDLRIVIKDFPIFGPDSINAVKVLKAANQQGKYQQMQALIHQQADSLTMDQLFDLAKGVKDLDINLLKKAVLKNDIATQIADTMALAAKLGIDATPTSIVGNKIVAGEITLDKLREMLATPDSSI